MMASTVKNGNDRLRKGNRRRRHTAGGNPAMNGHPIHGEWQYSQLRYATETGDEKLWLKCDLKIF